MLYSALPIHNVPSVAAYICDEQPSHTTQQDFNLLLEEVVGADFKNRNVCIFVAVRRLRLCCNVFLPYSNDRLTLPFTQISPDI